MELGELRARLRRDYLGDAVEEYLYEDETLNQFIGDAQRQVCLRARALIDSVTEEVTMYELAAGTRCVQLHPRILAVRFARIGTCDPLTGITAKRLWKRCPGWDVSDSGTPEFWIPDYQEGYLYFDRPVSEDSTLRLSVWRTPIEAEDLEDDGDEPVIAESWHEDLLDWAAYRAFNLKDSELEDPARANNHLATFEAKVGRLPSMTEIRLWGISPIVGVPAEFI